jgi:outer membrane protein
MKYVSLILNVVLLLAVLFLYYVHFMNPNFMKGDASTNVAVGTGEMRIAYIDTDSLFQAYTYYDDISKDYREKRDRVQKQLEDRTRKLEEKFVSFQRRAQAGLMSQNDVRRSEEELAREQQDLQIYQQTVANGLLEEEQLLNKELYEKIVAYLEGYNKDQRYDLILNYTKGSAIWLAEDGLDITGEIISGLNAQYEQEKTTTPAPADSK